jgi:hypothetical protein
MCWSKKKLEKANEQTLIEEFREAAYEQAK